MYDGKFVVVVGVGMGVGVIYFFVGSLLGMVDFVVFGNVGGKMFMEVLDFFFVFDNYKVIVDMNIDVGRIIFMVFELF